MSIDTKKNKRSFILDFGCGDGLWLEENGGPNVIGIDIDPKFLEKAKLKAKKGTKFVICDGHQLPFKDNSFETVHVLSVLHHMDDFDSVISEIDRVLNGVLDITEITDDNFLFCFIRKLVKSWKRLPIKSFFKSYDLERKIAKKIIIDDVKLGGFMPIPFIKVFLYEIGVPLRFLNRLEMIYDTLVRNANLERNLASWVRITGHNHIADVRN